MGGLHHRHDAGLDRLRQLGHASTAAARSGSVLQVSVGKKREKGSLMEGKPFVALELRMADAQDLGPRIKAADRIVGRLY
jgi:hypothetical protein